MKFTLFTAILFSIGWMSVAFAGEGRPVPCCLTVSEINIPAENIVKYVIQNATLCLITAVRFHTKKNKVICSDPDSNWAKKVMQIVDGRLTPKPIKCFTSTTNVIPITTTTDETSGTETEISTSTTVTPAVTTIETSTPGTEISKTTIIPTSVSTDDPESTVITCGTGEITAPPTTTTTTGNIKTSSKKKLSKMMIRKSGKSKKGLRKVDVSPDCCNTVTNTRIPVEDVVFYDMQETNLCLVRAIRFHTKKNIMICSDPDNFGAQIAKATVDGRTTAPTSYYTSTTYLIPTTASTEKTLGSETETSTSRPVPPIVTTIETSGAETSTSRPVPPIVTTIETSGPETSTSTPVPPIVTTIKTSGPETSTSTPVPPIVTTIKTSGPETSTSTPVPPTTIKTSGPETSTSTPVPPIVTTIKTSGPETSTSTPVPPTTIKTSGPETSTSTPVPPIVTTIKTSGPETSTSTPVPPIVTTIKTSGPETEISKTTTQTTSVSKENPKYSLSTATTFQIGEIVTFGVFGDVTSSTTKDCCLTVTRNKPAFHDIVDYRVQETPLCSVRAVLFITVENNIICSSPEDWVQDYIQNLNIRRKTTEKPDKREFAITRIKPLEQDQRRPIETKEIFQLDGLSNLEKKQMESLVTSVSSEINDPYEDINKYFCLKTEQSKYFCIKQP